ncbi:MAG: hypothetical protein ACKPE3_01120 [Sphaerospermopsis kisseleviana]
MANATLTSTGSVQVAIKESGVQGYQGVFCIWKRGKNQQSARFSYS